MKTINTSTITKEIKRLCIEAATFIGDDVLNKLKESKNKEKGLAKDILDQIIENDIIAKNEFVPMCQDTGITIVFVEIGNQVFIDGDLNEAINEGVRQGYTEGYLRKSVVSSPLNRKNTFDNTPAITIITSLSPAACSGKEFSRNIKLLPLIAASATAGCSIPASKGGLVSGWPPHLTTQKFSLKYRLAPVSCAFCPRTLRPD